MRELLRATESAALVLVLMIAGSVALWIGVPLGWLWIGSQVQGWTGSLAAALAVAMAGVILTVAAAVPLLGALAHRHREVRALRGRDDLGNLPLEAVMVTSAGAAVVLFVAWFFLLSGSSPVPLNVSN